MIPVPQQVLEALAGLFGTAAERLMHYGGGDEGSDGIVYAYPFEQRARLLKILPVPLTEQRRGLFSLEERLRFVRFLGENGARIVFPQFSAGGRLYETFQWEEHVWVGYSMEVAPGKTPHSKEWDGAFFRAWGETIGRLHRLTQQYPTWEASHDSESEQTFLTWQEEWQDFFDWCKDDAVKQKWVDMRRQLEALPVKRDSFGFIHNDPHLWNLVAEGNQITLLDFDVANHHWFISDIAIACESILFDHSGGMDRPVKNQARLIEFLRYFREGYERENVLGQEWWNLLDLFITYRRMLLFIVMYKTISAKPAWLRSWKKMILAQPEVAAKRGGIL